MSALNKWMHKREEWENFSINVISNNFGKKNYKFTVHKESKNGRRDAKKKKKKNLKEESFQKKSKDCLESTQKY